MFKRIMIAGLLLLGSSSLSLASPYPYQPSFYIGPMLTYIGTANSSNVDYQGLSPKFAAGYGGTIKESPIYLALELNGQLKTITIHNHRGNTPGLKPSYSVDANLIPGIYLDDILLGYARLGMIYTHFDNLDLTRGGYQVGVGLETTLAGAWNIRGEYVYTNYRSINGIGSPKSDEFGIGVTYKFGFNC